MKINIKLAVFYSKMALLNITQLIIESFGALYAVITNEKKILIKNDLVYFIHNFFKLSVFENFLFEIISCRNLKIDRILTNSIFLINSIISEICLIDIYFDYIVLL
uniref:Uncharacterized protein n=1 Tax=Lotharella vacuolata TaxID=74820 RepID=A0A0H5BGV3_9EUKA|nr:hypothetical protein [Lotharella vacuolata]